MKNNSWAKIDLGFCEEQAQSENLVIGELMHILLIYSRNKGSNMPTLLYEYKDSTLGEKESLC